MGATGEQLNQADGGAARTGRGVARGRWLAALVALVVVAVLALGFLADALGALPQQPTHGALTQQVGRSTVSLTIITAPAAAGQASRQTEALQLQVMDASGAAVVGARAQCALSMPTMAMALPVVTATAASQPGRYRCASQALASGAWRLALTLTLPSGETDRATFDFVVA